MSLLKTSVCQRIAIALTVVYVLTSGWIAPAKTAVAQSSWTPPAWYMNPEEAKAFSRTLLRIKPTFRTTTPSNEVTRQAKQLVNYYLSSTTHPETTDVAIPKLIDRLMSEFSPTSTSAQVRAIMMDEVLSNARDLQTHPRTIIRFNGLVAAASLSTKPASTQGGVQTPSVPYNPSHKLFIEIIKDPQQYQGCRILAARGLARVCRDGENAPSSNEKSDIAQALVDTLAANPPSSVPGEWWFRYRMVEALGLVDRIDNSATDPIVIETLMGILVKKDELPVIRAMAAQSLSQLPLPPSANLPLIVSETMKLLAEISTAYTEAPTAQGLQEAFARIYLAFRPAKERDAKQKKWGFLYQVERTGLTTHSAMVTSAWGAAFPILKPFIERAGEVPSAASVAAVTAWVTQNPVGNRQVMPNGKEF